MEFININSKRDRKKEEKKEREREINSDICYKLKHLKYDKKYSLTQEFYKNL